MNVVDKFIRCPHCHADTTLDTLEAEILQAISEAERNTGKATTRAVSMRVMLSETQTYRYLLRLEKGGKVRRIGTKGGWRVAA